MKRLYLFIFLLSYIVAATSSGLLAQVRYLTKTVTITVPTVLDLQLNTGANQVVDFNMTSKIDAGIELLGATTLTYSTNKAWFVTIKSSTANFSGGDAGNPMPASVIEYRINGSGGAYIPLSSSDQPLLATSAAKSVRGKGSSSLDFRINPGYIYPAAQNYSLQLIYTISNL